MPKDALVDNLIGMCATRCGHCTPCVAAQRLVAFDVRCEALTAERNTTQAEAERAEAAEARCASLTRVLAQLRDDGMVMDAAYPIIASVLLGEEVADSPALARLSDAEATIKELKAVVREFVHEFKGEDFEAGLWPMMDRANAALAPASGTTPTQDKEPT